MALRGPAPAGTKVARARFSVRACLQIRRLLGASLPREVPLKSIGQFNAAQGAESFGFRDLKSVYWNLEAARLYEESLARGESQLSRHGAITADTGTHTGRSPKDKFTVRDALTDKSVWWDNNNAMSPEHFETLLADFIAHAKGKDLFAQDLYGGADPLQPQDIADTVFWVATLPAHVNINSLEIMPVSQSFAGFQIHRKS